MCDKNKKSAEILRESRRIIPGGVSNPPRTFKSAAAPTFVAEKGSGSRLYDADGNEYIDCVCPNILGHAFEPVIERAAEALKNGMSFGVPTAAELRLAGLITQAMPYVEMIRLTPSAAQAVMGALRLARGYTGRSIILKFDGCYHGDSDNMLIRAGLLGCEKSCGLMPVIAQGVVNLPYNRASSVRELFEKHGEDIAAVIVEPAAASIGVVPPEEGFLEALRDVTAASGALLIFDEVTTGFRLAYGGAAEINGVEPDLTVLGEVVGGGMPLAAFGGKRKIMERLSPLGDVYQSGSVSSIAVAAGIAALGYLSEHKEIYTRLEEGASRLQTLMQSAADEACVPIKISRCASMLTPFFNASAAKDFTDAAGCNAQAYSDYFKFMLGKGVFVPHSQFEPMFLSVAHSDDDINHIAAAFREYTEKYAVELSRI